MKKYLFLALLLLFFYTDISARTQNELFDLGVKSFKQEKYQDAIHLFSEIIEKDPGHADAYKKRGICYIKQKKYDAAIDDFMKAKKLFPDLKGIHSNLGVAWYYKKNYIHAIENYGIAIDKSPGSYAPYFNRALCFAELNRKEEALADIEDALKLKPDYYWAICYKADLLAEKQDNIKAAKTYEQAIKINPSNSYAKEKLAELQKKIKLKKKDDENKAVSQAEKREKIQTDKNAHTLIIKQANGTGYTIQTGAYLNRENARVMHKKLVKMGFDSKTLVLNDSKGRKWYLARSGSYPDKKRAKKDFNLLKDKLGITPVIRPIGAW